MVLFDINPEVNAALDEEGLLFVVICEVEPLLWINPDTIVLVDDTVCGKLPCLSQCKLLLEDKFKKFVDP